MTKTYRENILTAQLPDSASAQSRAALDLARTSRMVTKGFGTLQDWSLAHSGRAVGAMIIRRGIAELVEGVPVTVNPWEGVAVIGGVQVPLDGEVVTGTPNLIIVHYSNHPITVLMYTENLGIR